MDELSILSDVLTCNTGWILAAALWAWASSYFSHDPSFTPEDTGALEFVICSKLGSAVSKGQMQHSDFLTWSFVLIYYELLAVFTLI